MSEPAQLQRIEELYYDALELPAAEREAFLASACAGDDALQNEVASLLVARDEAAGFLSRPVLEHVSLGGEQRPNMTARLGSTIGHYKLLSVLGVGGMGEVFLAEDTRLHRQVALKLLPPQFSQQAGRVRRFEQEARATTALNHPNIVTLYDTGQHENSYFIVNEFVDGQTLRAYLNEHRALPVSEALTIAQQIATALAAAHAAGIVHRDIKPENVMLRRDGFVKVLDFGLAKLADAVPDSIRDETQDEENPHSALHTPHSQTAAGALLGTIRYMSPEQARASSVDTRTDIFSLGVVLYEMLAGRTPFHRETATETLAAILEAEPTALPASMPAALQQLLKGALHKDRTQRTQTTAKIAKTLRQIAEETEFSSRTSGWHFWLSRWPVWVSILTLLAALAAVVFFARQPRGNFESAVLPNLKTKGIDEWKVDQEGSQFGILYSPDDKQIAFSKNEDGSKDIFVEPSEGGEVKRLTKDAWDDVNPIWSPDGKQVIYLSLRNKKELWQVPSNGGANTQITILPDSLSGSIVYLLRWSRDGQRIYLLAQCNIYALELTTKAFISLTNFQLSPCKLNHAELSADEQWVAYHDKIAGIEQVWALKLKGGTPIQITHEGEENTFPIWHSDGQRIFYTSRRNGVGQICIAYLDGRVPLQLTFSHENLTLWDISHDGSRLVYVTERNEADVFRFDLNTNLETRVTARRNLEISPTVAPDSHAFIYQQADTLEKLLTGTLWLQPPEMGALPVRLTENAFEPRWSPQAAQSNTAVAFLRKANRKWSLWKMNTDGTGTQPLVSDDVMFAGVWQFPFRWLKTAGFNWSPDGKSLAYLSSKSGSLNIWTIASDGTNERMVTTNTSNTSKLYSPTFAPDSRQIAYLMMERIGNATQTQLYVADEKAVRSLFKTAARVSLLGWSANGEELLLISDEGSLAQLATVTLLRIKLASGVITEFARVPAAYVNSFRLAPTHNQIAYVTRQQNQDTLWRLTLADNNSKRIATNDDSLVYFAELAWAPDAHSLFVSKQSSSIALRAIENVQ